MVLLINDDVLFKIPFCQKNPNRFKKTLQQCKVFFILKQ